MIERTIMADCSADKGVSVALWIVPSTLIAGGKPVVIKRSDPFLFDPSFSAGFASAALPVRVPFTFTPSGRRPGDYALEIFLVDRAKPEPLPC